MIERTRYLKEECHISSDNIVAIELDDDRNAELRKYYFTDLGLAMRSRIIKPYSSLYSRFANNVRSSNLPTNLSLSMYKGTAITA